MIPLKMPRREQTPAPFDKPQYADGANIPRKEYDATIIGGVNFPSRQTEAKYVPSRRIVDCSNKLSVLSYIYHPEEALEASKGLT